MAGKALVTGGAGFIGSHLSELLLEDGWEVFALDDLSTGSFRNVEHLKERPEFHLVVDSVLASSVVEEPVRTMVTNVQGTETVLQYCNTFGKRVLIASSSEVYGDHREERPLTENDRRVYGPVTERRCLYADSKAMDEFLALGYHQERRLDCVIARFFNTVGPRQSGQYGMVIPRFVERALSGAPLEVHGDGTQTRSFCHVSDTIRAVRDLMDGRSLQGEIFNVGSTERIRILDLAKRVLEATESSSRVEYVPYDAVYGLGIEDTLHREPSIEKIGAAIGWRPSLDLDRILADVIDHTRRAPAAAEL